MQGSRHYMTLPVGWLNFTQTLKESNSSQRGQLSCWVMAGCSYRQKVWLGNCTGHDHLFVSDNDEDDHDDNNNLMLIIVVYRWSCLRWPKSKLVRVGRDTKSQNFPVGRISRAKTSWTEWVNRFCNIYAPKVRKLLLRHIRAKSA